jgi:hypothetical protein
MALVVSRRYRGAETGRTLTRGAPLEPRDYDALAARWIPREVADLAQIRRVSDAEGSVIVGKNGSGNYSGLLIPYTLPGTVDARGYRLRVDHPALDEHNKPRYKYLAEPGSTNKLYFAPLTDRAWLQDATIPVVITEGELKTVSLSRLAQHELGDAADRPRFLALGLSGVWNFRGTTGKTTDATGTRVDQRGPIPDLALIAWKQRTVIIFFDADLEGNAKVRQARQALTDELKQRGARVKWVFWPKQIPPGVKGVDDLLAAEGPDFVLAMIRDARAEKLTVEHQARAARQFTALREDLYHLEIPGLGITFEIDRLRREHQELIGELCVRCDLPGARAYDGNLSIADFNLSSARARSERAKLLADRSKAGELDWLQMLEEFCQRVLQAEREGKPGVDLRILPKPEVDDAVKVAGFTFPKRHPSMIFGDGGAAKSYAALYLAGLMAKQGMTVGFFDWELAGEDHRDRLERIFGNQQMPQIIYARCERPLVSEVDRLRRIVREYGIEYSFFDSVAFACDGPPEAAEVAGRYFRAVRQIGGGSAHLAHITKGENGDRKPFGSSFWHNGARATWFVERAESATDEVIDIAFHHRKANLGPLRGPIGFQIKFTDDCTTFKPAHVAENPDLAVKMSIRQRMAFLLQKGALSPEAIAEELDASSDTVTRTARRYKDQFVVLQGGKIGRLEMGRTA